MRLHRLVFILAFLLLILAVFYDAADIFTLLTCLAAMLVCTLLEMKRIA